MNNMKNKKVILICAIALICVGLVVAILCIGAGGTAELKLKVESQGGLPLSDIKVRVFTDKALNEQLTVDETDREGLVRFEGKTNKTYYVTLEELPQGYNASESFEIKGDNATIKLKAVMLQEGIEGVDLKLGSVMSDFTITDTNGTEFKISQLLENKKAVVLNFWFHNCEPCKMEFPFLQQAYTEFSNDLELLAINPLDGTTDSVNSFADSNGLTFPMFVGDTEWNNVLGIGASFPTTVVIDRYGTVCMVHKGAITSKEELEQIFAHFTADDYKQTLIKNLSDIA